MSTRWRLGMYTLEADPDCLFRGIEVIKLPKRHLETLLLLVKAEGKVVSKEEFFENVWSGLHVEEGNLTQTIFLLRKALGRLPNGGEYIETMPRRGYRLVPGIAERIVETEVPLPPCVHEAAAEEEAGSSDLPIWPAEVVSVVPGPGAGVPLPVPAAAPRVRWAALSVAAGSAVLVGMLLWFGWKLHERPRLTGTVRLTHDGVYKEVLAPLLTDGSRLFFTEIVNNQNRLAEVSVLGGFSVQHDAPTAAHTAIAVSRWHDGVLFGKTWEEGHRSGSAVETSSSEEPMILRTENGGVRPLGQISGHSAAWSPDGQRLAYTDGHTLMLADGDGDRVRSLSRVAGVPYWPAWSGDGHTLRFSVQDADATSSLWEVAADGGTPHAVLARSLNTKFACCGQWSANGGWFAYVANRQNRSSVWLRRERGMFAGREFEIASGPMDFWRSPIFSENGHALYAIGEQARGELMRFDEARQHWWPALNGLSADTLQVSPDRQWMVYTLYPEGTVWRSRVDGGDKRQLSAAGEMGRFPHWSPNGQRVVYMGARPGQAWCVEEVDAAGGGAPRAVLPEPASQGAATYSPEGDRVAFGRVMAFGMTVGAGTGISVVDLRSGRVEKVPGSDGLWIARWSPDGRWLAATTADRQQLMLFEWKTETWTRLSGQGVNDLVWSHDGRTLYFDAHNGRDASVFRVNMEDRAVRRYADLGGLQRTGFDGWRLSLDAEDQLLVLRQAGTVEVYRLDLDLPD